MIAATSLFLVPAPAVPVATEIGGGCGNDHEVSLSDGDLGRAPRTGVDLTGLVGLDRFDDLVIAGSEGGGVGGGVVRVCFRRLSLHAGEGTDSSRTCEGT